MEGKAKRGVPRHALHVVGTLPARREHARRVRPGPGSRRLRAAGTVAGLIALMVGAIAIANRVSPFE